MPSMPQLLSGIFCDYFMVDASGKYSYIGVFERIGAVTFPAVHKMMYIVCSLTGEPNATLPALLTIWSPDDTMLLSTNESQVQFSPDGRTLMVHLLYDVNFKMAGAYSVVVEAAGKPAGRLTLDVYQAPVAQPPA
jgi:hypothetical protein